MSETKKYPKPTSPLCIRAESTAGDVVKCVVDTLKKSGNTGEKLFRMTEEATTQGYKKVYNKVNLIYDKIDTQRKKMILERKLSNVFSEIGEAVFKEKVVKGSDSAEDLLESNS